MLQSEWKVLMSGIWFSALVFAAWFSVCGVTHAVRERRAMSMDRNAAERIRRFLFCMAGHFLNAGRGRKLQRMSASCQGAL